MAKYKLLICDGLGTEGIDLLKTNADLSFDVCASIARADLEKVIGDYDALIVRTATGIDAALFALAKNLRLVVRAGTGLDHIDLRAAQARGVEVRNTQTANSNAAAEHTIGLLLSLARRIPASDARIKAGAWERGEAWNGFELYGKTLGIVGVGNIGKLVAEKAMALGMRVVGNDIAIHSFAQLPDKFRYLESRFKMAKDKHILYEMADMVTLHVPLNETTRGMIGAAELARMRKGAYLVNCARGGIVDETALLEALESGQIAGAALDVLSQEPPAFPNPLLSHPRVVATAHLGGATLEAQARISTVAAEQVLAFFNDPFEKDPS